MAILPELSVRPDGWITNPSAAPVPNGWITTPQSGGTAGRGIIDSAFEDVPAQPPALTGPGAMRYATYLATKLSQNLDLTPDEVVAAKRLGVPLPPPRPRNPAPRIPAPPAPAGPPAP